ncbi:MAG: rod shape-determining protein RodA [Gammaproteobacteria bacterium]|nr:rod shape-determining protein RodA [Gammaproteobacteria bacterium]
MSILEPGYHKLGRSLAQKLHLDLPLLTGLLLLSAVGFIVLYSAGGQDAGLLLRHAVRLALGFGLMLMVAQVPPQRLQEIAPWAYGAALLMLVGVLLFGDQSKGAQRWLDLGVIRFQPAELMKLALPLMLARYLGKRRLPPSAKRVLVCSVMILIPVALIEEKDQYCTALLVIGAGLFVLLLSGIRWWIIGGSALLASAAAPVLWHFLHDYQRKRLLIFLNPESDPLGSGYHIIQSTIAIGSGGFSGKGWLNGTQSYLDFIPERTTDFVFAVYSEEFGLIGALLLLALFIAVTARGLYIALRAPDHFTRLLAGSLTLSFSLYIFVNISMVSGLMPVVGVPLPLISYGGTALVTLMTSFGMLMAIHTHPKKPV